MYMQYLSVKSMMTTIFSVIVNFRQARLSSSHPPPPPSHPQPSISKLTCNRSSSNLKYKPRRHFRCIPGNACYAKLAPDLTELCTDQPSLFDCLNIKII